MPEGEPMYPNDDEPDVRERRVRWRLDKTVNVSHILSILSVIMLGVVFGLSMDNRVNLLEYVTNQQPSVDLRQDAERRELSQDIKAQLKEINDKLDKLSQSGRL